MLSFSISKEDGVHFCWSELTQTNGSVSKFIRKFHKINCLSKDRGAFLHISYESLRRVIIGNNREQISNVKMVINMYGDRIVGERSGKFASKEESRSVISDRPRERN